MPPIKPTDLHPAYAGSDHNVLMRKVPPDLGVAEAIKYTFNLWDASGTTVLTKRSALAGGSDSEIRVVTPGLNGEILVQVDVGDTAGLSGAYSYDILAESGDGAPAAFRQYLAVGKWEIVPARPGTFPFGGP